MQRLTVQHGFVLAATLWILAIITIAAGFFSLWAYRAAVLANDMQADLQGEIDIQSTRATVLYLLSTQRYTYAGLTVPLARSSKAGTEGGFGRLEDGLGEEALEAALEEAFQELEAAPKQMDSLDGPSLLPVGGEIGLDDRVYYGYGSARFALQDEKGLFNVNFLVKQWAVRLLGILGIDAELHGPLLAKHADYIDIDDLHRINGAESYHYQAQDLPPPTNRLLRTPLENLRILGWAEQSSLWDTGLWRQLTTSTAMGGLPNFNFAPPLILQSFGITDAEGMERIIQARRNRTPYFNKLMNRALVNLGISLDEGIPLPSVFLRLTLWHSGTQRMRQIHIHMTPLAHKQKPWEIEYTLEQALYPAYKIAPLRAQTSLFASMPPVISQFMNDEL
ncbi:MAG: general secretion pathway protein GspK [Gammaproteobacteria bacterium]|nr:general secretion pathway protein GspK [Gammaproteobacteria bacterium]